MKKRVVGRYFCILAGLLSLSFSAKGEDREPMPTDPHEKAAYLIRAGNLGDAISIYQKLADQKPQDPERLKELMWAHWQANHYTEAAQIAAKLTRMVPKDTEVYNLWAKSQAALGQKQAAVWTYEKSLSINSDQLSVRLAVARLHIDLKDFDTASKQLANLKDRYPNEANVYGNLARIAFLKGSYAEAEPLWLKAVTLAPDDLLFRVHEAETLYHLGQMSRAHEKLRKILADEKEPWPAKDRREIWNLLAIVPAPAGEGQEALHPYDHPLGVDEVQIGLALGRLYSDLRDYEAATDILIDLEKTHKDNPEIYSRLAKQYFLRNMFQEAAQAWASAVKLSPEDVTFRFEEARSLYYAGDHKTSRQKLQSVAALQSNSKWRAIDFLTDVALVNKDLGGAQDYLESNLSDLHRPDEPRFLRLANIYLERGQIQKCLDTINKFIASNPRDGRALMFKGGVLMQQGRTVEAIDMYEKVIELNPAAVRAYFSLADAYYAINHPREALSTIEKARAIDPTDPNLLVWQARYLYDARNVTASKRLLEDFIRTTPKTVVPILLYHGLTALSQDPLLAYTVHFSQAAFEDHMRAVAASGYTPVTAEQVNDWMLHKAELPPKPILITFDDDLLNAFRVADPILQKYKLKATMFIPLVNVDRNLPGYASWEQLQVYAKSPRWEMQSHGDLAHVRIVVDPDGRNGLYLLNPQWVPAENRYESLAEWQQRVSEDHVSAKKKMFDHFGKEPVAYAFPEGDFGQMGLPSAQHAAEINLAEVRKAFGTSFHQDVYGVNLRTRDPHQMTRLEPDKNMSGDDLMKWFTEKNPLTFARITLLRQATWEGRIHEAQHWLADIRQNTEAYPQLLLTEEAHIRYSAHDLVRAEQLADQASAFGDTPDLDRLKSSIETEKRFIWNPSLVYQEDNRDRNNWVFRQSLSTWGWGGARWALQQIWGSYKEKNTADVTQNGAGVSSAIRLGLFHTLDLRAVGQSLSGQSNQTTYTASAGLRSQWTDEWSTDIEGGRSLYETAAALNAGIAERYVRAAVSWVQDGPWEMKSKARLGDLTDGNNRYTAEFETTRLLIPETEFRLGYHFETANMREIRHQYYSPQHFIAHEAVIQFSTRVPPGFRFDFRYLPGYGKEDSTQGEFINDLELAFPIPCGKQTMLTPEIWLSETPSYHRQSYSVSLTHRF